VLAALGCRDDARSPTSPQEPTAPALATTSASTLSFSQISAGSSHTCGVTTDNRAYCWGGGTALGDGKNVTSSKPVAVAGGLRFVQVSAGATHTCGVTTDDRAYCWGNNEDAPPSTRLRARCILVASPPPYLCSAMSSWQASIAVECASGHLAER
jgi:alpha-tubulin suppressor-like RCC1 family protein